MRLTDTQRRIFLDRYARVNPDMPFTSDEERLAAIEAQLQPGSGFDPHWLESAPIEMFDRVARAIADTDEEFHQFYDLLQDFKFVPGGRILSGAGTDTEVTYYNCYVIPVETKNRRENRMFEGYPAQEKRTDAGADSREAIVDTIGVMVDILSRGGGVGVNWSVLRPKGAYLSRVNGTSSGPVEWMEFASSAVGTVEQGGTRRGAAMFMLDDWHPDVMRFIDAKRNHTKIENANVSVAVSDAFMEAVKADAVWQLRFPDTTHEAYDREWDGDLQAWLDKGYPVKTYTELPARSIWLAIVEAAWDNGEPGVVFLDRYNKLSTAEGVERIISVNPCGEQGLGAYSVCNLGSMNLAAYVSDPNSGPGSDQSLFDWARFEADVKTAVRFLDNVVDKNFYFLPENEQIQKKLRRIGLGVMGLADTLILLGLRYGSRDAVNFTSKVYKRLKETAVRASAELAKERGPAPGWDPGMIVRPYLESIEDEETFRLLMDYGLRNLFLLTQAPTGTTALLAGVNSGLEPYFNFGYQRNDRTGSHWVDADIVARYKAWHPEYDPEKPVDFFVSADMVTVEEHIAMQAAAQRFIDSSVSKTINAPNSHTVEDVLNAYRLAYDSGLKGVAYFRDGCGRAQVLYRQNPQERINELEAEVSDLQSQLDRALEPRPNEPTPAQSYHRPQKLEGTTRKIRTASGTAYVTVNHDDGRAVEMFVNVGKAGSDLMAMGEAVGRLASLALQRGASLADISSQLTGVGGYRKLNPSLPHAIGESIDEPTLWGIPIRVNLAKALTPDIKMAFADPEPGAFEVEVVDKSGEVIFDSRRPVNTGALCSQCGNATVVREEGCQKCHACGWSAC